MNNKALREELTRDEGYQLKAYKDSVGLWTIGVGHLLGQAQRMSEITHEEAMALLDMDIQIARAVAWKWVPNLWNWDMELGGDVRQRVVINMAFNLGNRLGTFKNTLASLNAGNWQDASERMLQSKWATQVGQRAVRLSKMIRTGEV